LNLTQYNDVCDSSELLEVILQTNSRLRIDGTEEQEAENGARKDVAQFECGAWTAHLEHLLISLVRQAANKDLPFAR